MNKYYPLHLLSISTQIALILSIFVGLAGLMIAPAVYADTHTVTNTNDNGPGSLRQAVADAADGDAINFNVTGVITLTGGELVITKNLTINGPGIEQLAISGNRQSRVISASGIITISGLAIRDGLIGDITTSGNGAGIFNNGGVLTLDDVAVYDNRFGAVGMGSGIYNNSGTVTLNNSVVYSNNSTLGIGGGVANNSGILTINSSEIHNNSGFVMAGGLYNDGGTVTVNNSELYHNTSLLGGGVANINGLLTINSSDIYTNTAGIGGGLYNTDKAVVNNSTIFSNSASTGAGLANLGVLMNINGSAINHNSSDGIGGGLLNMAGTVSITNSTISSNRVATSGGGVYNTDNGTVNLTHVTIAGNTAITGSGMVLLTGTVKATGTLLTDNQNHDCYREASGTLISLGYNLVENPDASCAFAAVGDVTGQDPQLGPLADNGGDTKTHALGLGSPALDHIPASVNGCGVAVATDQRGRSRPYPAGGSCDVGAYEKDTAEVYLPVVLKG